MGVAVLPLGYVFLFLSVRLYVLSKYVNCSCSILFIVLENTKMSIIGKTSYSSTQLFFPALTVAAISIWNTSTPVLVIMNLHIPHMLAILSTLPPFWTFIYTIFVCTINKIKVVSISSIELCWCFAMCPGIPKQHCSCKEKERTIGRTPFWCIAEMSLPSTVSTKGHSVLKTTGSFSFLVKVWCSWGITDLKEQTTNQPHNDFKPSFM